jgi:hypothetical protein
VPVLAGLALPIRYQKEDGLALAGEAGGVGGAVDSAGAGMRPTTTPGGRKKKFIQGGEKCLMDLDEEEASAVDLAEVWASAFVVLLLRGPM